MRHAVATLVNLEVSYYSRYAALPVRKAVVVRCKA